MCPTTGDQARGGSRTLETQGEHDPIQLWMPRPKMLPHKHAVPLFSVSLVSSARHTSRPLPQAQANMYTLQVRNISQSPLHLDNATVRMCNATNRRSLVAVYRWRL